MGILDPPGLLRALNLFDVPSKSAARTNLGAAYAGSSPKVFNIVDGFGADPTGAVLFDTAITNAYAAAAVSGGRVYWPAGNYRGSVTLTNTAGNVSTVTDGRWCTTYNYIGSGDAFRVYGTAQNTFMGDILGLTIDGTNAAAGACGLHLGDCIQPRLDLAIRNFSGAGSIGLHLDNTAYWTEQVHGTVYVRNNSSNVVFDVTANGTNSFARTNLKVYIQASPGQDGVVVQNGALLYNHALEIRGNFTSSNSTPMSNAVLRVTGQAPAGDPNITPGTYSSIRSGRLDIGAECLPGTYAPTTIIFGTTGSNSILGCYGVLDFSLSGNPFTKSNYSSTNANTFGFTGPISGDTNLAESPYGTYAAKVTQALLYNRSNFNATGNLYVGSGDFFSLTLSQSITVAFQGSFLSGPQRKTVIITQAASGGPYTVTWPSPGSPTLSSPAVIFPGGPPAMSTTPGAVDVITLVTTDGIRWYGTAQLDTTAADIQPDGIQAAGGTGKPADAGHVHKDSSGLGLLLAPAGATGETFTRHLGTTYFSGLTSGLVYASAIPLPRGLAVNSITLHQGSTAFAGVTHGWYALLDSSLTVRAVSADQTTAWGGVNTPVTLSVAGSGYATTYGGLFYVAFCAAFTGSGSFVGAVGTVGGILSVAPLLAASSSTGQTTPPAAGTTLAALSNVPAARFYAYTS
jgi:hypothetical protein